MMSDKPNGIPKPDAQGALRRLILVLLFAIGMLVYSYGWTVTDIDLSLPQEEIRQESVTRAMRELLSPRLFDQHRDLATFEAPILMDCSTGETPAQASPSETEVYVVVEPACASVDDIVTVYIYNAEPNADARIRWQPPEAEGEELNARPVTVIETGREDIVLGNEGNFVGTIEVPRIRAGEGKIHSLQVLVAVPNGPIVFSDTATQVMGRMVETIFMALVATSIAIPISVVISFFAAKNLMRRLRLSVGSMLLAFLSLAIGIWLGNNYLVRLADWGLSIGKGDIGQPIGAVLAILVPILVAVATSFALNYFSKLNGSKDKRDDYDNPFLQAASALLTSLVAIFMIGAIAGLCILLGQNIRNAADVLRPADLLEPAKWAQNAFADLIWSFGNLLVLLGSISELFRAGLSAIVAGFGLAAIASALFGNSLRRVTGPMSNILAAIMGAISGALIMMVSAAFGLWAALLGVVPLIVGGLLAGNLLLQIYARIEKANPNIRATGRQTLVRNLIFALGFFGTAFYLFNSLSLARSLIDGTLPPQTLIFSIQFSGINVAMTNYMFNAAWIGLLLGGISGAISGLHGVFPLGDTLYNFARITLNIVRSIEPLIMGLVFVIWVGIGPFAGVLALTLHSIASLGKLYSEQIENIDQGPIEALESTGANQLQIILYAVVPQVIPPYIAFTLYRWDINVRMSTIIGFVGGGGIGLLLSQQINLLRYRDAGVAVLAIAVIVSILDYASATIRERIG
jgi:phosphonate ABC transporter permease subunit PhnE